MYPTGIDKKDVDRIFSVLASSGMFDILYDYFKSIEKDEQKSFNLVAELVAVGKDQVLMQNQYGRLSFIRDLVTHFDRYKRSE